MREDLDNELTPVIAIMVTMARSVRESMRQASGALLASDHSLAQQVAVRADEVDVLYRVVEDRVYDLVGRRQPASGDLRIVLTALNVAGDLKRMGALAGLVARATLRRSPEPAVGPELRELFREMSAVADDLAARAVAALADQDPVQAAQLEQVDDAMDELHRQVFAVMLSPQWPLGVEAAVDGALLGRYYERYADHAVNVGRYVVFLVTGKAV